MAKHIYCMKIKLLLESCQMVYILPDFAGKQNLKLVDIQTGGVLTKVVDEAWEMFILAE